MLPLERDVEPPAFRTVHLTGDPVLEDEAPQPRPSVVRHGLDAAGRPLSERRGGLEQRVYFYDLLAAARRDLVEP